MNFFNTIYLSMQIWGSIMSVIIVLCMVIPKRTKRESDKVYMSMLLLNMGAMLAEAFAALQQGETGDILHAVVCGAYFASFAFSSLLAAEFVRFEQAYLTRKLHRKPLRQMVIFCGALCLAQYVLLFINMFMPVLYEVSAQNTFSRLRAYPLVYLSSGITMVLAFGILWQYRKELSKSEQVTFGVYILIPLISILMTVCMADIDCGQIGNTVTLLIMYVFLQAEYGRLAAEQENELTQNRVAMMMSQIQPHFLFNALNSIEYLCNIGSPDAGKAVNHFAKFLRGNMDSITQRETIPFDQELSHLKNYLYIEQLRFPHIEVIYDLQCTNFQLPPLTLQPLVENAIKHGLRDKKEDAWVKVCTWENDTDYVIKVEDNGCGFIPKSVKTKGERSHVGLMNIKTRLRMVSQGNVDIDSTPGEGTTVCVWIPKDPEA